MNNLVNRSPSIAILAKQTKSLNCVEVSTQGLLGLGRVGNCESRAEAENVSLGDHFPRSVEFARQIEHQPQPPIVGFTPPFTERLVDELLPAIFELLIPDHLELLSELIYQTLCCVAEK